jgi:phage/plasmid-like protein (TIGR03299 family)
VLRSVLADPSTESPEDCTVLALAENRRPAVWFSCATKWRQKEDSMAVETRNAVLAPQRQAPWQEFVTAFPGGATFNDAIQQVGLDYEVGFSTIRMENGLPIKDKRATYRTDTGENLGVVGSKYTIKQNRDAFAFLQELTDGGDLVPVGGGSLRGGTRPFIQTRLPDNIVIAGDEYVPFIFCANSHDGAVQFTISLSGIRAVCWNTYAANLKAPRRFTVKHLASMDGRLEDARRVLNISTNYFAQYKEALSRLAEQPLSLDGFKMQVVDRLFPLPDGEPTEKQVDFVAKKRAQLLTIYMQSTLMPERGTKYAALQAVTEWADHVKNGLDAAQKTEWVLLGDGVELKDRAVSFIESAR